MSRIPNTTHESLSTSSRWEFYLLDTLRIVMYWWGQRSSELILHALVDLGYGFPDGFACS